MTRKQHTHFTPPKLLHRVVVEVEVDTPCSEQVARHTLITTLYKATGQAPANLTGGRTHLATSSTARKLVRYNVLAWSQALTRYKEKLRKEFGKDDVQA